MCGQPAQYFLEFLPAHLLDHLHLRSDWAQSRLVGYLPNSTTGQVQETATPRHVEIRPSRFEIKKNTSQADHILGQTVSGCPTCEN